MEQTISTILFSLGSALATGFGQWIFYLRKNRVSNDRSEIDNLKEIAREWREAATQWKDMADEYQKKAIDNMRKIEELESKVRELERSLDKATRRIACLEKSEKPVKS